MRGGRLTHTLTHFQSPRATPKTSPVSNYPIEAAVSEYLGRLPFLRLPVDDEPGPDSLRGYIERNAIALTSGLHEPMIDPPSPSWLGLCSGRDKVRRSGLWNQRHVDENYEPRFLDVLETAIKRSTDL
jgi:hypothetical protein